MIVSFCNCPTQYHSFGKFRGKISIGNQSRTSGDSLNRCIDVDAPINILIDCISVVDREGRGADLLWVVGPASVLKHRLPARIAMAALEAENLCSSPDPLGWQTSMVSHFFVKNNRGMAPVGDHFSMLTMGDLRGRLKYPFPHRRELAAGGPGGGGVARC